MRYLPSPLYDHPLSDLKTQLRKTFAQGLSLKNQTSSSLLFFRADDIGVPSHQFNEMIRLFLKYKVPLCLAVVPTWLSKTRIQALQQETGKSSQFCWHQHGWLHRNHEPSGKKQEFGPNRSTEQIKRDLQNGRRRLSKLLEEDFSPFFTPPWNRCNASTLNHLEKLQYKGVSRSLGASPISPENLPDLQVNVDLHTRKEKNQEDSLNCLLGEIIAALTSGSTGVMLHHQRMNSNAFNLLDVFFQILEDFKEIETVHFDDICDS